MNKLKRALLAIPIYGLFLTLACSYIPFTPDCERLTKNLSYDGLVDYFDRGPDLVRYSSKIWDDSKISRFTTYYWETCGGVTSMAYVHDQLYTLNEHGMWVKSGRNNYISLVGRSVEEIRGE